MAIKLRVRNPATKKIEVHTPTNANDLVQHLGWKLIGRVDDGKAEVHDIQTIMDNAASMPKAVQNAGPDKEDDGEDADAS